MIALTLGELVEVEPALARLGAERLQAKTAYVISKTIRKVTKECEIFREQHDKLVNELGAVDGDVIKVKPENAVAFQKRRKELLEIAVSLDSNPIPWAYLEELTIGSSDLAALTPILTGLPD